MMRNPLFLGEGGKKRWKELLRAKSIKQRKFDSDKYLAWAYIARNIDDSINDKIVIMNNYDVHYPNHNVLFLWNACREIATGIGAQSDGVVLGKAFNLKLVNDAWSTYFKEVKDSSRAFRRLIIPTEQLEGSSGTPYL